MTTFLIRESRQTVQKILRGGELGCIRLLAKGGSIPIPPTDGQELLTNGTFNTDIAGWTPYGTPSPGVPVWNTGAAQLPSIAGNLVGISQNVIGLTIGATYFVSADWSYAAGTAELQIRIGGSIGTGGQLQIRNTVQTVSPMDGQFVATLTSVWFSVQVASATGTIARFDNISMKREL
jgi:hypothetical protein